jgi:hypothetical protein
MSSGDPLACDLTQRGSSTWHMLGVPHNIIESLSEIGPLDDVKGKEEK